VTLLFIFKVEFKSKKIFLENGNELKYFDCLIARLFDGN